MGKGWVRTPEQEEYLDSEFKGYLKARKKGEVKIWRAKLHEKWEERWPEKQALINEWNFNDNTTMFDTAQMDALGKALAARKKVRFSYILQIHILNTISPYSNYTTTSVGARMQSPHVPKTRKRYSLVISPKHLQKKVAKKQRESSLSLKSIATVITNPSFKTWLTSS